MMLLVDRYLYYIPDNDTNISVCVAMTYAKSAILRFLIHQGPVVQSVVSLTSSLRVISLTLLTDSMYNILKFFAEKM